VLFVSLGGLLAFVEGTYPGNIIHIVDPGHAEIYITERRRPGSELCLEHLVPWYRRLLIPDYEHDTVAVLVNGKQELMLRTQEPVLDDAKQPWIVTALVGSSADGPFVDCAVHQEDEPILGIYRRVFGPDRRAACEAFKAKHCGALKLQATG
jgi:hypothetical protein